VKRWEKLSLLLSSRLLTLGIVQETLSQEGKPSTAIHGSFECLQFIHLALGNSLGTNCQLHLITRMVSVILPSHIPFILSAARLLRASHSALPGEKSASSLPTHRPIRYAPFPWPGRVWPLLILFSSLLLNKLCYGGKICNNLCSSSGPSRHSIRRISNMVQHVAAHHLSRLACLYVRQSTDAASL